MAACELRAVHLHAGRAGDADGRAEAVLLRPAPPGSGGPPRVCSGATGRYAGDRSDAGAPCGTAGRAGGLHGAVGPPRTTVSHLPMRDVWGDMADVALPVVVNRISVDEISIPAWIKNNAGWWADDLIDDSAFLQGIQYLIKEGIMVVPPTETSESPESQQVPAWIKNNAGWWADGQIDDNSFVSGIQYLIKNGIIIV